MALTHIGNMETVGAADHVEPFGISEDELRAQQYRRLTPKELIGADNMAKLKAHGYTIVQVVSTGG